jgi:hypothetical protein
MRVFVLIPAVLISVGVALSLQESQAAWRIVVNGIGVFLAWLGVLFVLRVRTRVGDGRVEVRRIRTVSLNLQSVQRARKAAHGTTVELLDGSQTLFPLYLPGVTEEWVWIDADVVEKALVPPEGRRPTGHDLRLATSGAFLPPDFVGFPKSQRT